MHVNFCMTLPNYMCLQRMVSDTDTALNKQVHLETSYYYAIATITLLSFE